MEIWRDNFKSSSLQVGFRIGLTRNMCEFLSAVADDVQWNTSSLGSASASPDSFVTMGRSLQKRGLIIRKSKSELDAILDRTNRNNRFDQYNWNSYRLSPAGEYVVALLKLSGMFLEADIATEKKARAKLARRGAR